MPETFDKDTPTFTSVKDFLEYSCLAGNAVRKASHNHDLREDVYSLEQFAQFKPSEYALRKGVKFNRFLPLVDTSKEDRFCVHFDVTEPYKHPTITEPLVRQLVKDESSVWNVNQERNTGSSIWNVTQEMRDAFLIQVNLLDGVRYVYRTPKSKHDNSLPTVDRMKLLLSGDHGKVDPSLVNTSLGYGGGGLLDNGNGSSVLAMSLDEGKCNVKGRVFGTEDELVDVGLTIDQKLAML